jgi:hypothetical protein
LESCWSWISILQYVEQGHVFMFVL